jgi:hypothetical protein
MQFNIGHGMEPLIFWTANRRQGQDRAIRRELSLYVDVTALILMGDWCSIAFADTQN